MQRRDSCSWPRRTAAAAAAIMAAALLTASCGAKTEPAPAETGNASGVRLAPPGAGEQPAMSQEQQPERKEDNAMAFELTSAAFAHGQPIPKKCTGEGADVSPPLKWTDPPAGTKSLALINDDPDAPMGTWVHWVIYGIGSDARELHEGVPKTENLPNGAKQGMTDFKRPGYGGPMPPPGKPHRYFFKLYALDTVLGLPPRATKAQVEKAMQGHILAEAQLMGTYQR